MAEVPGGGEAFKAFDAIRTAGGLFENENRDEGTRSAEMGQALGDRNPELAAAVENKDRQTGGPEHLRGGETKQLTAAERNPGTTAERSEGNVAERMKEREILEAQLEGLDPITESPSVTAESRTETRSTAVA